MAQVATSVQDYMTRLKEIGEDDDFINRFYVALTDDGLLDMEERLIEDGQGIELLVPVLALYEQWKEGMGVVEWAKVWAYNEALGDGDRNWLVSEEMIGEGEPSNKDVSTNPAGSKY